jgi:phosphatidate cytidylyltransferase
LVWCAAVYALGSDVLGIPLAALLVLVVVLGSGRGGGRVENAEATLMGVLYVGVLASFALEVRTTSFDGFSRQQNALLAILILSGIWASDIASYFSGRWFGRRHPFPDISPGKTLAGYIGGFLGSAAVVYGGAYQMPFLPLHHGAALGVIVGLGAPVGDLVESMIKRDAGVKDASAAIPGHGGILDRFDSFLFVYPLVYVYVTATKALG